MGQLIEFTNNHPFLVAATIGLGLAILFYELRLRASGLTAISTAQAVGLINRGARVVDVRDKAQFDKGHIVDAINLPGSDPDNASGKAPNKKKTIVLVCDNGSASGRCVDVWRKAGYENAFSIKGGLAAWRQENLPIVSGK